MHSLCSLSLAALVFAGCAADNNTPSRGPSAASGAAGAPAPTVAGVAGTRGDVAMPSTAPPIVGISTPSGSAPANTGECGAVTEMAENRRQPVDVIFVIDTSLSMVEEIGFVQDNMNAFSKQIRESGIDVHVVMLSSEQTGMPAGFETDGVCIASPLGSGMCPADSRPPEYVHIVQPIMQRTILDSCIQRYPDYKEYLRPDALKTFVAVSDDDAMRQGFSSDPTVHVDKFIGDVEGLEPGSSMWTNWRYSAIYPFTECLGSFSTGAAHAELVERTGGVGGDLCTQDFAPVFNAIATQLVEQATLSCDWAIPAPPSGETFDSTRTNVQLSLNGSVEQLPKTASMLDCGTRDAWHYDSEADPRRVVACPATCTRIQAAKDAAVSVLFGCATILL